MLQDNNPKFSGLFDNILKGIQTGVQVLGAAGGSGGAPKPDACLNRQVSGDSAMSKCVPQVMALFDAVEAQRSQMAPADYIAAMEKIAAIFSNTQYFDQSIGGKSKQIREAAQAAAAQRVAQARASVGATTVLGTDANGNLVTNTQTGTANNELIAGVPNLYLFGGGFGVIALLLLLKK